MTGYVAKLAFAAVTPGTSRKLDRVNGAPLGLPADAWPKCEVCGTAMTFIAQLAHDAKRLDLGAAGRVLYLFLCTNRATAMRIGAEKGCAYYAGFPKSPKRAHAVVIHDVGKKLPPQLPHPDGRATFAELAITGWRKVTERLTPKWTRWMLRGEGRDPGGDRPEGITEPKIGGVPCWVQDPTHMPRGWEYVAMWPHAATLTLSPVPRRTLRAWVANNAKRAAAEGVPRVTTVFADQRPATIANGNDPAGPRDELKLSIDGSYVRLRPNGAATVGVIDSGTIYLLRPQKPAPGVPVFDLMWIAR